MEQRIGNLAYKEANTYGACVVRIWRGLGQRQNGSKGVLFKVFRG